MQSHDDGSHSPKGKEQTACMHCVRQWLWLQASLWQTGVPWGKGCRCELPQCWTRCQLCTFPPQQMRWWSTGSLSQSTATAKPTRRKTIWIHHINTRVCTKFRKAGKVLQVWRAFSGSGSIEKWMNPSWAWEKYGKWTRDIWVLKKYGKNGLHPFGSGKKKNEKVD